MFQIRTFDLSNTSENIVDDMLAVAFNESFSKYDNSNYKSEAPFEVDKMHVKHMLNTVFDLPRNHGG